MRKFGILSLLLMLVGCSSSLYTQGRKMSDTGQYDQAIDLFYESIKTDSQVAESWRELGVTYFRQGDYVLAEEALQQADRIATDARTKLYLGLVYEKQQEYDQALQAYSASLALDPSRQTKTMVRAHMNSLAMKKVNWEVSQAISRESSLDVASIPENTIAVSEFDVTNLPPEIAPIGLGLAQFTAADLAKVQSLTVVERMKIDALLQELELNTTNLVDPSTRVRVGKLLGSRQIVSGSVQDLGKRDIGIYSAIGNTVDGSTEHLQPEEGQLEDIFRMQKDFVFEIIATMNITLTAEERAAIEEVPTESYIAFMAYCRGLAYQNRGEYERAAIEFNSAAAEDPNFSDASTQSESANDMITAISEVGDGSIEDAMIAASDQELLGPGTDQILGNVVDGSNFMPPEESSGTTPDQPPRDGRTTVRVVGYADGQR